MSGRQTMGVRLVNLGDGQSLVAIARNAEASEPAVEVEDGPDGADPDGPDATNLAAETSETDITDAGGEPAGDDAE
jgi:DNA gyrase subunit A